MRDAPPLRQRCVLHDAKLRVKLGMPLARNASHLEVGLHGRVIKASAAHEADAPLRVDIVPDLQHQLVLGQQMEDFDRHRISRRIIDTIIISGRTHKPESPESFVC